MIITSLTAHETMRTQTPSSSLPYAPAAKVPLTQLSHLRQANARGLLRLLREHNPCSKADLVRLSGLSAPTVSSVVSHLESLGLVENLGEGESSGGRPPGLLRFHANHGCVAGVDIGGTRLRMVLADLNGSILTQWSTRFTDKERTPRAVCTLIREGLRIMCEEGGTSLKKILHIAAGAPGITNVDSGVVISAPNLLDWNDVPLRSMLEKELGVSTTVENDTNLAAVGEHWHGSAREVNNFVFVALGTGVGAGIFLRGRLHHGRDWSAGEIGYMPVGGQGRERLHVRATGQLERAIGGQGIEREWLRLLDRDRKRNDQSLAKLRAPEIFDLAAEGDRLAAEVVRYTAEILADCISSIALLLDPELVVLGGGVGSHPELCRATQRLLQLNEFACPRATSSTLGTQAQLHGAISVGLVASEARLLGEHTR